MTIITNSTDNTSILWGYGDLYPIMSIEGLSYQTLTSDQFIRNTILSARSSSSNSLFTSLRNAIRSKYGNSILMTSYTWLPLTGVTSIMPPNEYSTNFAYDNAGHLSSIYDFTGTKNTYHYQYINPYNSGTQNADNHILTKTFLNAQGSKFTTNTQYNDGIGRPYMYASNSQNTSGKYVYLLKQYDRKGRLGKVWLPIAIGTTCEEIDSTVIEQTSRSYYNDNYPNDTRSYDALDRLIEEMPAGEDWQNNGKATRRAYTSNDTYGVIHYIAPLSSITLQQQGYYNSGMLIGEVETDEDGHDLTTYKNLRGQKVLERRMPINNLSSYKQDTHYVYNDLGQLRYVISPEYQFAGYKAKYAYEYRYDERGRVVKKILPGCEFIQYWYDDADRMTFMQDATLRGKGLYRYYLYDKFGRLCVQGLCSDCNRSSAVNAVTYVAVGSGYCGTGYSVANASRITNHTLEIVNYYDEYDYLRLYPDKPLLNRDNNVCVTGLMTGEVNTTSNDETMVKSLYYDALGRSTEMRMYGLEGMFSTNTTEYTFDSNINKSVETIFPNNSISDTLACTTIYNYHPNSGLLTTKQLAIKYGNTERMQQIQQFVYDDIGRITSVGRGGSAGLVSYNYNLRGWQTDISGQGFEEHLYYTNGSGVPCYNGNISSLQWKAYGDEYMRGYKYTYDTWNRLTDAIYGERNFDKHHNRYDERVLEYSLNGNIRRLQRRGLKDDGQYGKIDNLSLSYDGNKLQTVHDDAAPVTSYESFDFKDGVSQEVEYTYNGAGALTSDSNKGISSIEYDNLNNPTEISFNNGNSTTYVYSPKGTKLQTRHSTIEYVPFISSEPGEELTTTIQREIITTNRYVGNCIFNGNGTVTYVFDGGYATIEAEGNTNIVFHYYTKDHLGSNRAVVNENGNIEQVTHYYPFGGIYGDASTQQSLQPYKYNGKEFNKDFELNLYDYGARWYDPIGSLAFTTMDPLCEDDCKVSPYAYCANNPVNAIDPDGRKKHNWLKGGSNNYDINNFNDDTNIINIWAHGLQRVIDGDAFGIEVLVVKNDEDNNKKYPFVRKIMDARDFSTVLNDASSEWRERTGEITIVMHSCATSVFIQTISKDPIFKDVVFIAPNNNVVVTSDSKKEYVKNVEIRNFVKKENGSNVRHKVIKRGLWYMIKNGNIVKKYDGRLTPGSRDFKY